MTATRRDICEVVKRILATKCIHGKSIREKKQKTSHTSDRTVCPVCDGVHDEEGDDTSVQTKCIVQPALQ